MKLSASLLRDVAGIVGAASIAWGAALIYKPAGFIVAGLLLVGGAYLSARGTGGA